MMTASDLTPVPIFLIMISGERSSPNPVYSSGMAPSGAKAGHFTSGLAVMTGNIIYYRSVVNLHRAIT